MTKYFASIANARKKRREASESDIIAEEINTVAEQPTIAQTATELKDQTIPTIIDTTDEVSSGLPNELQQERPRIERDPMEKIEENINQTEGADFDDPKEALAKEVARVGTIPDIETGEVSNDLEVARLKTEGELSNQEDNATVYDTNNLDFVTADEARNKLKLNHVSRDGLVSLTDGAFEIDDNLDVAIKPTLQSSDELSVRLKNFLAANGLLDENGRLSVAVSNAAALTLGETIQDDVNKRSQEERGRYTDTMSEGAGFDSDLFNTTEKEKAVTGFKINPEYIRGNVARGVFDKILENPNIVEGTNIMTGRGGGSQLLDPFLLDMMDTILWQSFIDSGYLTLYKRIDPKTNKVIEEKYIISQKGDAYYNSTRPILKALKKDGRINVSSTPSIAGGQSLPGFERQRRDAGAYSLKSMMDDNLTIENVTKQHLGSISYTIVRDRFLFAKAIVNNLIKINEDGSYVESLKEMSPEGFFSTNQWATSVGLDEGKWRKSQARAYNYQLSINGQDKSSEAEAERIAKANAQADRVMRAQAKEVYQTIVDGDAQLGKTFYNKIFHATAVGRYFVRNTVLNPLDSKVVRNIVGSTKVNMVDVKSGLGTEKMEDFMYIIGKNLMNNDNTTPLKGQKQGPDTEDMGWNAIVSDVKKIFKANATTNATYQRWLKTGRLLKNIKPDVTLEELNIILGTEGANELGSFQKPDEWGYKFQSFIDFANWHEAREAYKRGGTNTSFRSLAQTQHDGKQSGIAIQARQNGDQDLLRLVGVIYNEEENVLPQGDIRDRFMSNLEESIGTVFKGNPDKMAMWQEIFIEFDTKGFSTIAKDLSKVPLMETSYGKAAMFNQETVINFINNKEYMDVITRNHAAAENVGKTYLRSELINDMNHLIEVNLGITLNFTHQKILSNLGTLWSMLNGIVPSYEGPLGTHQFLGGRENTDTGKKIVVQTPRGPVERSIKRTEARGDRVSAKKLKFNQDTNQFEMPEMSRFGQELANQIAVLPVQQIDAAIMAKTINLVNKGRSVPKFLIPIHDAIITDLDSVRDYHGTINEQFEAVNKDYKIARAVRTGYSKDYSSMRKQIDPEGTYTVSSEDPLGPINPQRALHSFILNEFNKEKIKDDLKGKPLNDRVVLRKGKTRASFLKEVAKLGWKVNGGTVKGYELLAMIREVQVYLNVFQQLQMWEQSSLRKEKRLYKDRRNGADLINRNPNYHTN
jgi:hypothetical protein